MSVPPHSSPAPIEPWEVLDLLTSLVQKSLVLYEADEHGQGRYRLLETVRQYSRERLMEGGEGATYRSQYRDYFVRLAQEAEQHYFGPEEAAWFERLEIEHDNLRAALDWCLEDPKRAELGLRLAGALGHFWQLRGYMREARERYAAVLAREGAAGRTEARGFALWRASMPFWLLGERRTAQALCEESLSIYRELGNKQGVGRLLWSLSLHTEDHATALALHEESISLLRASGERPILAYAINTLGRRMLAHGGYAKARSLFEECIALSWEWGNRESAAHALFGLGLLGQSQGDYEEARMRYAEALQIYSTLGQRYDEMPGVLWLLGTTAAAQGQNQRAARLWGATESLCEAIGRPWPPVDRAEHDRSVAAARSALGEPAFTAAWAEGRALSLEEAIKYALEAGGTG